MCRMARGPPRPSIRVSIRPFIHSFSKRLSSTYFVPHLYWGWTGTVGVRAEIQWLVLSISTTPSWPVPLSYMPCVQLGPRSRWFILSSVLHTLHSPEGGQGSQLFLTGPEAFSSPSSMNAQGHRLSTELSPTLLLTITRLFVTAPVKPGLLGLVPPVGREAVGARLPPGPVCTDEPCELQCPCPSQQPLDSHCYHGLCPLTLGVLCLLCDIFALSSWSCCLSLAY